MKTIYLNLTALIFVLVSCGSPESAQEVESNDAQSTTDELPQEQTEEIIEEIPQLPMEYVTIETSKGNISVELDPNAAPITVENFLTYVDEGFYNGTVFHRVIPNFMIQGGGFSKEGAKKETHDPIILESQNGLSNMTGTIAMARTGAPNSATAQFFINVADNTFLNYSGGNPGYAVFGKVTAGMDVVNEIRQVQTSVKNGMQDWPVEDVEIIKITRD
jgi:peptidyl-prolyl cis-trans isomerase B (cyclophilin B)